MSALQRAGALTPGSYRAWRWSAGERQIASIAVRGAESGVRLIYTVGQGEGPRRNVDEHITVQRHPCRLGGARPFFLCPRCMGSVLNLHLSAGRFACRICAGLTYATQRERARDRHLRAANRLRQRLGGELGVQSEFGPRPKGMRWSTYDRIVEEIERREALAVEELAGFLVKMGARCELKTARRQAKGFWK